MTTFYMRLSANATFVRLVRSEYKALARNANKLGTPVRCETEYHSGTPAKFMTVFIEGHKNA